LGVYVVPSAPSPLRGAEGAVTPPAATLPVPGDLIPLVEDEELRTEADEARASELVAKDALAVKRTLEAEAKTQLEARKTALEALKKKISLAGSEKRDADKKALEAEPPKEEAGPKLFERHRGPRGGKGLIGVGETLHPPPRDSGRGFLVCWQRATAASWPAAERENARRMWRWSNVLMRRPPSAPA